jgi:hypothetical protein
MAEALQGEPAHAETPAKRRQGRFKLRPWVRALHRDIGYLAIGMTVVYALSGLAVNHISDWDPNFTHVDVDHQVTLPADASDDQAVTRAVLERVAPGTTPADVYRPVDGELEISLSDQRTLYVNLSSGVVREEGQKPRWLLRAVNWLHLNRGKQAWTYIADGYAVFLLFLAVSGLFMIPGRKGLIGRGGLLALTGALVPIIYVALSGGP